MTLDGKNAMILGGAQGIGRAIAEAYAAAGARVEIADIAVERAEAAAASLGGAGGHTAAQVDVTSEASLRALFSQWSATSRKIDVFVQCVGIPFLRKSFWEIDVSAWDTLMEINLRGMFISCREVARLMVEQKSGSIITMASVAGTLAQKGNGPYGTSKAAVAHFTRIMAQDLAEHNVRANAIAPGPVDTPLLRSHGQVAIDRFVARIPMGRVADAAEITGAAVYLASDAASYTTGHVLTVDGGFSTSGLM